MEADLVFRVDVVLEELGVRTMETERLVEADDREAAIA